MKTLNVHFQQLGARSALKIQKALSLLEVKGWWNEKHFKVVASTEDMDRAWEIIKVDWWKRDNFMKNPVIIANHVYKVENIVWKATRIWVQWNQLVIEGVFSQANPLGRLLADLYEEGMVKTVSVGFIPKTRDVKNPKIIVESELLELSFVAVPCNPNALSLDQKQLLEEYWMLENEEQECSSLSDDNSEEKEHGSFSSVVEDIVKNEWKEREKDGDCEMGDEIVYEGICGNTWEDEGSDEDENFDNWEVKCSDTEEWSDGDSENKDLGNLGNWGVNQKIFDFESKLNERIFCSFMLKEIQTRRNQDAHYMEIQVKQYKHISSLLNDIKALLVTLVDGNTKKQTEASIIAKETLQWAARAINSGLEKYKKALRN